MSVRHRYIQPLRQAVAALHCDQSGAALTEFVITLPVWILLFAGVITMSKMGMNTVANRLDTQTKLWDGVFAASTGKSAEHMTTAGAGGIAAAESIRLAAVSGNPHAIATGANGVVMGALALKGSWGESAARTKPFEYLPGANVPSVKLSPGDALQKGSGYPVQIVNDGLANADWKSGGGSGISTVINMFGDALSGSGGLAALAAGIRYGEVYVENPSPPVGTLFGQNFTAMSHANVLVAPSPLTGAEADYLPLVLSRFVAEGEKNYSVMMNFGKSEWDGDSSGDGGYDFGDPNEQMQRDREEAERQAQEQQGDD